MAQSLAFRNFEKPIRALEFNNLQVSVPAAGNTDILEVPCLGLRRLSAQFVNTGFAFDAFNVLARMATAGAAAGQAYQTLYSVSADYTSPRGILVGASGDLTILASGATLGWIILDVFGIESIKLQASANGGTTVVDVYATGS